MQALLIRIWDTVEVLQDTWISHFPYRNEVHASMRDFQSDLYALLERSQCLDEAPEQGQVLGMCHELLFGL